VNLEFLLLLLVFPWNMKTPTLLASLLLLPFATLYAVELKLPALFTDHMVLQRDVAAPVWGWTEAGEVVVVEFAGQKKTVRADATGRWMAKLDPLPASAESRELKAGGLVVCDVLVGDVGLCSGQSNMGMALRDAVDGGKEVADANFPAIRLFSVAQNPVLAPASDVKGQWSPCSPQTVATLLGCGLLFWTRIAARPDGSHRAAAQCLWRHASGGVDTAGGAQDSARAG
jgi:sialate O-acetylesterase